MPYGQLNSTGVPKEPRTGCVGVGRWMAMNHGKVVGMVIQFLCITVGLIFEDSRQGLRKSPTAKPNYTKGICIEICMLKSALFLAQRMNST